MKKLIGTAVLSLGVLAGSAFASPAPVQGPAVKTVVRTSTGRAVEVHHRRHHRRHHRWHHRRHM